MFFFLHRMLPVHLFNTAHQTFPNYTIYLCYHYTYQYTNTNIQKTKHMDNIGILAYWISAIVVSKPTPFTNLCILQKLLLLLLSSIFAHLSVTRIHGTAPFRKSVQLNIFIFKHKISIHYLVNVFFLPFNSFDLFSFRLHRYLFINN